MTTQLIPNELKAIKERVNLTSPPPWEYVNTEDGPMIFRGPVLKEYGEFGTVLGTYQETVFDCLEPSETRETDLDFIAHARQDIPALLMVLEAVTAERDELLAETKRQAEVILSLDYQLRMAKGGN